MKAYTRREADESTGMLAARIRDTVERWERRTGLRVQTIYFDRVANDPDNEFAIQVCSRYTKPVNS